MMRNRGLTVNRRLPSWQSRVLYRPNVIRQGLCVTEGGFFPPLPKPGKFFSEPGRPLFPAFFSPCTPQESWSASWNIENEFAVLSNPVKGFKMMNAKNILSIIAGALALAACSGPQEENLRMVPLTVPATVPMTSYGPHARVVVAGIDYTEVHDEWMNPDIMKKATPGNTRVVISRGRQRGQLMVGDEVAMDFPVCALRKRQCIMFPICMMPPCLTSCG